MSSTAVFTKASPLDALQNWLPKLVLAPSMLIVLVGFYGYILWTFLLSFTNSSFMPSYKWVGLLQYERLWNNDRWWVASKNLLVFGGLFITISLAIGVLLAVLLDQRAAWRRAGGAQSRPCQGCSAMLQGSLAAAGAGGRRVGWGGLAAGSRLTVIRLHHAEPDAAEPRPAAPPHLPQRG